MLVGLDEIEWSKLESAYNNAGAIPGMLRDMASCSEEEFDDVFDEFMQEIFHQGTVYEASYHAIPFLIQLIELSIDLDRKYQYLYVLAELAQSTVVGQVGRGTTYISHFRIQLQIHNALEKAYDRFLHLASHEDADIKLLSVYILSHLADKQRQTPPVLVHSVERFDDAFTQMVAIWSYVRVLRQYSHYIGYESYLQQLLEWAQSEWDFLARATAALGYIQLAYKQLFGQPPNPLPHVIEDLLIKIFEVDMLALVEQAAENSESNYASPDIFSDFIPFVDEEELIPDKTYLWLLVVKRSSLTPQNSFFCVKCLLDTVFNLKHIKEAGNLSKQVIYYENYSSSKQQRNWLWEEVNRLKGHTERKLSMKGLFPYKQGEDLSKLQREAVEAVVSCDAFWQIKTNLLSFFYGLPDNRDQLRALVTASS